MELEADDDAVAVLRRNGLEPDVLADALEALERARPGENKLPRWLKKSMSYLSTHPDTAERIARLRKTAR
jgi:Zn-dependent protease with chaperone function